MTKMITELTLCEVGVGLAWEGKDYVSFLSLAAYGLVHSPKGQIFIHILTLSLHDECSRSTQALSKQRTLSFHVRFSLVENLGGLTGLIISVRFQVGKSISGVFLWRRRRAEGVVASYVVYPPKALQAHVSAAFSL